MESILSYVLHIQVKMKSVPGTERPGMCVRSFLGLCLEEGSVLG